MVAQEGKSLSLLLLLLLSHVCTLSLSISMLKFVIIYIHHCLPKHFGNLGHVIAGYALCGEMCGEM